MPQQKTIIASDSLYEELQLAVAHRISENTQPVFTTDSDPEAIWNLYLGQIPEEMRQHYNCSACRHFLKKYGGLTTITTEGESVPLLWSLNGEGLGFFEDIVRSLYKYVAQRRVSGVFRWDVDGASWGQARTGEWTHLHGECRFSHESRVMRPHEQMADKLQDFIIMQQGLRDYPLAAVEQAVRVLDSDALTRSEKARGIAVWLLELQRDLDQSPKAVRRNLIWAAVATAPPGYCHIRSTVISTLLDDIVAGLSFAKISERWSKKLHPLQYQRPTAAPREGQIKEAEKLVADLGIAPALKRKYASLSDVLLCLWAPTETQLEQTRSEGVFDHLRAEAKIKQVEIPAMTMTWERFADRVLPDALGLEVMTLSNGPYYGLVTASDPEAPPVLQWDGLEGLPRNPVSWYFYNQGSSPQQWGLPTRSWVPVTCVFPSPHRWQRPDLFQHQGDHIFFALEGAADSRNESLGLFPEILKKELRGARSVIEAHSGRMKLDAGDPPLANGIALQRNASRNEGRTLYLRVRTSLGLSTYNIDRWE